MGERALNTHVSYFIRDGFVEESLAKLWNLRNIREIFKMGWEATGESEMFCRWGGFSG